MLHYGAPLESARRAAIFIHGRGASAEDILGIAPELATNDVAYLAPQAAGNTWYPFSFFSDRAERTRADLRAGVIGGLVATLASDGFPTERVVILGFSQEPARAGICRAQRGRYAALIALSGGLIGPPAHRAAMLARWVARRYLSAAATWITHSTRTRARIGGSVSPDGRASTNASTNGWDTPSTPTNWSR